jgi:hypothetical protein
MPVGVIVVLKLVDINHDDRERLMESTGADEFLMQLRFEIAKLKSWVFSSVISIG